MATKHEQILNFIRELDIGHKISVRQIAKALHVSEGTAYRAIKEAENQGYVSTIERVGTIRIEKKGKENIEKLSYAEVVNIVDGQVLGGRKGLHKTLNRFIIGAMELDAMMSYIEPGGLLIVGNRDEAHELALREGAAVLITGGFGASDQSKKLADELELPIISSSYDSFTVATMINRAIYDQLIKKDIILVSDILSPVSQTNFLYTTDTVADWHELNQITTEINYPVVDKNMKVQGIVTTKDILGKDKEILIDRIMSRNPIVVNASTSIATAAHMMIWEGVDSLPVVNEGGRLLGMISREDVLQALQTIQNQPQVGETIEDVIASQINDVSNIKEDFFQFYVTPQMTNYLGTISYGVITTVVTTVGRRIFFKNKKGDLVVENITIYFLKPIQLESMMDIKPRILEETRRYGKVDVELYQNGQAVGKAFMIVQFINRN